MTVDEAKSLVYVEVEKFENGLRKAQISNYDNSVNFVLDCQRLMDDLRLNVDRRILLGLTMTSNSLENYSDVTKPLKQCQYNLEKHIEREIKNYNNSQFLSKRVL